MIRRKGDDGQGASVSTGYVKMHEVDDLKRPLPKIFFLPRVVTICGSV